MLVLHDPFTTKLHNYLPFQTTHIHDFFQTGESEWNWFQAMWCIQNACLHTTFSSNRDEKFTMNVSIPLWSDALLFCSLKALSTVARQRGKHNHTKSNELMALENACAVWLKWLEEWSVVGFGLLDIGCSGCFSHVFAMHSKIRYYLRIWYDLCWIWEDVEREISPTVCCS